MQALFDVSLAHRDGNGFRPGVITAPGERFGFVAPSLRHQLGWRPDNENRGGGQIIGFHAGHFTAQWVHDLHCLPKSHAVGRSFARPGDQHAALDPMENKPVVAVIQQHPAEIGWMLSQVQDHLRHRRVGRARFAVGFEQAHRPAVTIHALEPLDAGDPLSDAHGVGFDQGVPLIVRAFLRIGAQLGEDDRHVRFGRILGRQHLAHRGNDVQEDGLSSDAVSDAIEHFVGMQRDVIEMILRSCLDRLLQVVHMNRLGRDADRGLGIGGLGCVVGGNHDLRIIRRRLIAARAVGRFIPHFPKLDSSPGVLYRLRDVFGPRREIVHRQGARLVFRIPFWAAGKDAAEHNVLAFQVAHLEIQRIPSPPSLFGFNRLPA